MNRTLKFIILALSIVMVGICLNGCAKNNIKSVSGLYFDTYISITAYDGIDEEVLNAALKKCDEYELIFSKTNSKSELYKINSREKNLSDDYYETYISKDMYDCLKECLFYACETDNMYNPALGTAISLWDYHSDSKNIPSSDELEEALRHVSADNIALSYDEVKSEYIIRIFDDKLMIDLGGAAKGYVANELVSFLKENGCSEAVIALGGNIYCIGSKHGNAFNVGIQKPFSTKGDIIKTVNVIDTSVVTSGIYERYFEEEGEIYHHIISSKDGCPVRNDLVSCTVISEDSLKADILSTALLCMGSEKAAEYVKIDSSIKVILINDRNEIIEIDNLQ